MTHSLSTLRSSALTWSRRRSRTSCWKMARRFAWATWNLRPSTRPATPWATSAFWRTASVCSSPAICSFAAASAALVKKKTPNLTCLSFPHTLSFSRHSRRRQPRAARFSHPLAPDGAVVCTRNPEFLILPHSSFFSILHPFRPEDSPPRHQHLPWPSRCHHTRPRVPHQLLPQAAGQQAPNGVSRMSAPNRLDNYF